MKHSSIELEIVFTWIDNGKECAMSSFYGEWNYPIPKKGEIISHKVKGYEGKVERVNWDLSLPNRVTLFVRSDRKSMGSYSRTTDENDGNSNKSISYKLRGEVVDDLLHFVQRATFRIDNFKVDQMEGIPDVELTFESKLTIDELKEILNTIEDSHVMIETLSEASFYTGDRKIPE